MQARVCPGWKSKPVAGKPGKHPQRSNLNWSIAPMTFIIPPHYSMLGNFIRCQFCLILYKLQSPGTSSSNTSSTFAYVGILGKFISAIQV